MAASWYRLGLQLRLTTGTLDRIRAQFSNPIDQLLEVLNTWLKAGGSPSWKTLTDALRSRTVGAIRLAGTLETKYCLLEGTEAHTSAASQPETIVIPPLHQPETIVIPPLPVSQPVASQSAIVATLPGQLTAGHTGMSIFIVRVCSTYSVCSPSLGLLKVQGRRECGNICEIICPLDLVHHYSCM